MSVDFGIWGAQSDGFVLFCLHWRSSRWLRHALSPPPTLPFPSRPFPLRSALPFLLLCARLLRAQGCRALWDKEVQTCLTFLDPLVERCWRLPQNAFAVFCSAEWRWMPLALTSAFFLLERDIQHFSENLLMWEIMSPRNEKTAQSQAGKSVRCFLLSRVGRELGYSTVHLADRFLSAALQRQAACLWGRGSDLWVHVVCWLNT